MTARLESAKELLDAPFRQLLAILEKAEVKAFRHERRLSGEYFRCSVRGKVYVERTLGRLIAAVHESVVKGRIA